jgi:hypothetical protein
MGDMYEGGSPSISNSSEHELLKVVEQDKAAKSNQKIKKLCRADSGKLHRVGHSMLSREVLAGLVQAGEDPKTLRRLERQYRAALRPAGVFGNLIFDIFWSSYLKLVLGGRLQAALMGAKKVGRNTTASALVPGPQPTLVCQDSGGLPSQGVPLLDDLPPDLLRDLVLVQRYERPHARELHRSLALLLLLRRGGEAALENWASEMLGGVQPRQEA